MPISYLGGIIGGYRSSNQPKPVDIILKDVKSRNGLRGCYSPIFPEKIEDVLNMFITLGLEFSPSLRLEIQSIVEGKMLQGMDTGDNAFLGVNHNDQLTLASPQKLGNMSNLHLPRPDNNLKDYLMNRNGRMFLCETEEIFTEFYIKVNKLGFDVGWTWNGEKSCYDPSTGMCMGLDEVKTYGISWHYAQQGLYDLNLSMFRFRLPEGGLEGKDLIRNRIYQRLWTDSTNDNPQLFKFNGDLDSRQDIVDQYGDVHINAMTISSCRPEEYFLPITEDNRQRWRDAWARYNDYQRQRRISERNNYIRQREIKSYNSKNNIDTFNRDVQTQLISESFHKHLTKALDNKVARCLLKLNKLGYMKNSTRNVTIRRSDKLLTYMPAGKDTEMTEDGVWIAKGRQNGKYGKVIRKLLNEQVPNFKFTDHEIEQLVNHIKASVADGDFEIVKGEQIRTWYNGETYWEDDDEIGTLGASCMRDPNCGRYLDIYCKNDNVQMIILKKEGFLVGRAILWDDKWVDRIYGTDSTIKAFKNFCKEKGYHCKSSQNSDPSQGWIHPETGESYNEDVVIELATEWESYPYADTFCFIDVHGGKLANNGSDLNNYAEMRDTCGGLEGDEFVYDEYDDRQIHIDDSVYLENHGYRTHVDNTSYCDVVCEYFLTDEMVETHDGRTAHEDSVRYVSSASTYAEDNEIFHCEQSGDNYINGYDGIEEVYLDEIGMTVASENVEDAYHDNGYAYVDDAWRDTNELTEEGYVEVNGEWSLSEDETETV